LTIRIEEKIAENKSRNGALRMISHEYRSDVMNERIEDIKGRNSVKNKHNSKKPSFKKYALSTYPLSSLISPGTEV
jgi:hypothetical protein